ncbi:MAG: c-type cytochrome [Saprospiraceae bacterium]|nr:c-type cytochrome [Saprospiraceae bacterium]
MMYKRLIIRCLNLVLVLGLSMPLWAQGNPDAGKVLFRNNCASCHNKNMVAALTGPALGGVQERWADYPIEDLYSWIKNSQALIATGHPRAVQVYNDNNKSLMQAFPALTDDDVTDVLAYIDGVYTGTYGAAAAAGAAAVAGGAEGSSSNNGTYYAIIIAFLGLLALILTRVMSRLKFLADKEAGLATQAPRSVWSILTSKGIISLLLFALIVFGGYTTVNNAIGLNRQQAYAPEQPIAFSHETHAGLHQIECQYCHDGARRSKHSVIPATNTCMNCHKAIKVGSKHGTAELTKIFAAAGFNPNDDTYIEDYGAMSEEEIEKIYKTWIQNNYIQENGKLDRKGDRITKDQWDGIKESLTSATKPQIQGPIEWVRIHNLPDHAYFNHAQHVTVGKVECQTCHGPVEEMEVVKQYSPLSMGWCINCHRQTEVQFTDNPYYSSYEKYHEELKDGTREGVTVEEIGGLECQKCHY